MEYTEFTGKTIEEALTAACEQFCATSDKVEYHVVEEGASIGANATVVCGHTIGKWALIGAGAVVTTNVPAHALMLGVPAQRKGWACECGELLPETLLCEKCGRKYKETKCGLEETK